MRLSSALRTVAVYEAGHGALVLLVGLGLLSLVHHDTRQFAERLMVHAYLNPAAHYPRAFIDVAGKLTDTRILLISGAAAVFALARFIEAYGLWHARRWAEWFAALSSGMYVPIELFELHERASWLSAGALVANIAIVAFMLFCVVHGRRGISADPVLRGRTFTG